MSFAFWSDGLISSEVDYSIPRLLGDRYPRRASETSHDDDPAELVDIAATF